MSDGGYYRMHRGWMDFRALDGEPFCRRAAWAWLIEQACWKPTKISIDGKTLQLRRGQLSHSTRYMAKAWGWSEARVRRFLTRLKTDAAIDAVSDAGQNVITICNYDKYQADPEASDAPTDAPTDAEATQQRRKEERREEGNPPGGRKTPDMVKAVFDGGINLLAGKGVPERQARTLVGKWRKITTDEKLLALFFDVERKSIVDPVPYIQAALTKPRIPGDPYAGIPAHD